MSEFQELFNNLEQVERYIKASKKGYFREHLGRLKERIEQRERFYTNKFKNDR